MLNLYGIDMFCWDQFNYFDPVYQQFGFLISRIACTAYTKSTSYKLYKWFRHVLGNANVFLLGYISMVQQISEKFFFDQAGQSILDVTFSTSIIKNIVEYSILLNSCSHNLSTLKKRTEKRLKQFPQLFMSNCWHYFGHFNYFCIFSTEISSVATGILKMLYLLKISCSL